MNENYGKLENGILTFAPSNLIIGDEQVFNATAEEYLSAGYLPIEYTPKPDNNEWQAVYTEVDGVILQSWVYEGRIHDHSNLTLLEDVTAKSLSGVPAVHILPTDAKDGDMCLYAPQNIITFEDSGKRVYIDWEKFKEPLSEDEFTQGGVVCYRDNGIATPLELSIMRTPLECTVNVLRISDFNEVSGFIVTFVAGELDTENSNYGNEDGVLGYYNSIDELPPYIDIPEFDRFDNPTNGGNAYLFHTEYKLMKYQGGEWIEAVESGVTEMQMQEYVTAAINGSLDEIEAMIDEIETLINESGVLDDES